MVNNKLCFITNNVIGLQLSRKRLKLTKYLRNKLEFKGVLFLQETRSVSNDEKVLIYTMLTLKQSKLKS